MGTETILNIVAGLLVGFAAGIGSSHLMIMKKMNQSVVTLATHAEQVRTLFGQVSESRENNNKCFQLHMEVLESMRGLTAQNTILIQSLHLRAERK